ncbi:MAG: HDIG domain-containing protein, partial [Candidatus Kapabacteria bacterium]|nr:HDIG domain-containing protein [Candidatus Kapabacteria bacterium]
MSKSTPNLFRKLDHNKAPETGREKTGLRYSGKIRLLIFIGTVFICTFFFSFHFNDNGNKLQEFNTVVGSTWTNKDVIASFTFPVYKDYKLYKEEAKEAYDSSPDIFIVKEESQKEYTDVLNAMLANLTAIIADSIDISETSSVFFTDEAKLTFTKLPKSQQSRETKRIIKSMHKLMNQIYKTGFIDISADDLKTDKIIIRQMPNTEAVYSSAQLVDPGTFSATAMSFLIPGLSKYSLPIVEEIVAKLNFPNIVHSESLTEELANLTENSVAKTESIFQKGKVIVVRGQIVDDETINILKSYDKSKFNFRGSVYSYTLILGNFGHVTLIFYVLVLYLYFMRKNIFYDNTKLMILSSILVFVSAMAWATIEISPKLPLEYFVLIPSMAMLVAIIYDSRTAFYMIVLMSFYTAGIRGNDFDSALTMFITAVLAAYTVRDIQNRTQIFRSIFYILIGFTLTIVSIGLERSADLMTIVNRLIVGGANSIVSPLFTFVVLILLEKYSNVTTDLKLQEYDKLDHPLLIRLKELAPGTYQHTLSLATLSENCARAIGANPLLTKVGAYFHDIGKMQKAEYYVENQSNMGNKHDLLTSRKSADIIRNHVSAGLKLAKEYKLPERISNFIPMHHGTTLIKHFYAKALEEAEVKGKVVNELDFRYPGIKPHNKETAILMICDAAEA